jgi:hypothetical protein
MFSPKMFLSPPTILWHGPQERRIEADAKNFPESRFKADPDKNYSLPELIDLIKELWAYGGNRIAVRFAYNGTMIPAIGFDHMAMRIGSSMRTDSCA